MEKIKIYVTERIAGILEKDAEGFEFFKKDGRTVNKNALLINLIVNYNDVFTRQQTEFAEFLKRKISPSGLSEKALGSLCFDICERLNERSAAPDNEKFDRLVSLKPTRESEPIIGYIENYCLNGRTLSEYFRSMFASYAAMPQDKREQIIFKRQYEAVLKAIKERKRVFITTRRSADRKTECAPYALATSKEELHCYVLVARGTCTTVRLSRIVSVTLLATEAKFLPEEVATFEKMKAYGPQFIYRKGEGEVLVELTDRGVEKFGSIYLHRPVPVRVEGNSYYFNCAHTQIIQYFIRLGEDAKIVYPQRVRDAVSSFHHRALMRYTKT